MAKPAALDGINLEPAKPELPPNPMRTPHDVQAAVEGVTVADRVTFLGDTYRISDRIGLMPLMKFAHAAQSGTNADDMEGLSAIYEMLRDCIHTDDWARFEKDAVDKKAEGDDLLPVVTQAIEVISARPTRRPSNSSAGPSTTSPSSTGSSASPATQNGRPMETLYTVDDLIRQAGG